MKKYVLMLIAFVALGVTTSMAQGRFSAGAELAVPMGDFGDAVGMGFGASVRYEGSLSGNLNYYAGLGYLTFGKKEYDFMGETIESKASMVPVVAGVKYYFTESFNGFYGSFDLSYNSVSVKVTVPGFGSASASSGEIGFAPGVGYHLGNIDISARYAIVSDADYLGVRIAYVFGGE